jgi:hypothetical protein
MSNIRISSNMSLKSYLVSILNKSFSTYRKSSKASPSKLAKSFTTSFYSMPETQPHSPINSSGSPKFSPNSKKIHITRTPDFLELTKTLKNFKILPKNSSKISYVNSPNNKKSSSVKSTTFTKKSPQSQAK